MINQTKKEIIKLLTNDYYTNKIIQINNYDYNEIITYIIKIYRYIKETHDLNSLYNQNIINIINNYKPTQKIYLKIELPEQIINHYKKQLQNKPKRINKSKQQNIPTPFYYTTYELLKIDENFPYEGINLTNNIEEDYNKLINDERNNIISTTYEENIQNIINNPNTISLIKEDKKYIIEDGRHRLIYIIKNKTPQYIPVKIKKKFEDKKVNDILFILKKKYNIKIIKNNPTNNEINLLLIIKNKYYKIENINELFNFFMLLDENKDISKYLQGDFNNILNTSLYPTYQKIIKEKETKEGKYIYTLNYDEIIKLFNINDITFYKIFNIYRENYLYNQIKQNKNVQVK